MHFSNHKLLVAFAMLFAVGLASCSGASPVPPAPTGGISTLSSATRSLKCYTLGNGTCSIARNGAVTLTLPSSPAPGDGSGVYFAADNSLNGVTLANVKALSFTVTGPYQAGSPRVSIPVTYNGSGSTAYVYPVTCDVLNTGSGSDSGTVVDPIGSPNGGNYCLEMQGYSSPQQYWPSWSSFIATFGSAVISNPPLFLADADNATGGTWILTNITTKK